MHKQADSGTVVTKFVTKFSGRGFTTDVPKWANIHSRICHHVKGLGREGNDQLDLAVGYCWRFENFSTASGNRAPLTSIFEAAPSISRRSSTCSRQSPCSWDVFTSANLYSASILLLSALDPGDQVGTQSQTNRHSQPRCMSRDFGNL